MPPEFIIAMTPLVVGGLAFLAYNHPRQYNWFSNAYFALWGLMCVFALSASSVQKAAVAAINSAPMLEDQRAIAISALTTVPQASPAFDLLFYMSWYGIFYVGALSCLPMLGLTAEAKELEKARRRELDYLERNA